MVKIPGVRRRIERLYGDIVEGLDESVHPYKHTLPPMVRLPAVGRPRDDILAEMEGLQARESERWRAGYVSGAVYQGDGEHIAFLNRVYALNAQSNPLHFDLWPSTVKYEAEIVAMTAHMLGVGRTQDEVVGTVTSGVRKAFCWPSALIATGRVRSAGSSTQNSSSPPPRMLPLTRRRTHLASSSSACPSAPTAGPTAMPWPPP